jgi:hypothetical protein
MKFRIKNNKTQSFELVREILKFAPTWGGLKITVALGKQADNTYVKVG